jgi:phage antirepressor YoqD-like protein
MNIVWFEASMSNMTIAVKDNAFDISKGAYMYLQDKQIVIGVDKDNKVIAIKGVDKGGYTVKDNPNNKSTYRINAKSLIKWLKSNGVEVGKYDCHWSEEEEVLTAGYAWTLMNGENVVEKSLHK